MRDKLAALTGKTVEESGDKQEKQGKGKKKGKDVPAADDSGDDES
jgi:hypothetical protein